MPVRLEGGGGGGGVSWVSVVSDFPPPPPPPRLNSYPGSQKMFVKSNLHWQPFSTMATSLQQQRPLNCVPNCQNINLSTTASFFRAWQSQKWLPNWFWSVMAHWWLRAILFWLCSIYSVAVSINCLQYL